MKLWQLALTIVVVMVVRDLFCWRWWDIAHTAVMLLFWTFFHAIFPRNLLAQIADIDI